MVCSQRTEEAGTEQALAEPRPPDFEPARLSIGDTTDATLQFMAKELNEKVTTTLEAASARVVEETRVRLRHELSAALQTFLAEASSRLRALEEEHLARSKAELQAGSTEQLKAQIGNIQAALSKPCSDLTTLAAEADAAVSSMALAVDAAAKNLQAAEKNIETRVAGVSDEIGRAHV